MILIYYTVIPCATEWSWSIGYWYWQFVYQYFQQEKSWVIIYMSVSFLFVSICDLLVNTRRYITVFYILFVTSNIVFVIFLYPGDTGHSIETMRGKRPNTEYFLVRIQENTERKAVRVALKQLLLFKKK